MFCVNSIFFDPMVLELFHLKHVVLSQNFFTEILLVPRNYQDQYVRLHFKLGSVLVQTDQCVAKRPESVINDALQ